MKVIGEERKRKKKSERECVYVCTECVCVLPGLLVISAFTNTSISNGNKIPKCTWKKIENGYICLIIDKNFII